MMNNPGPYTLAALGITTALTSSAQTAIEDLSGLTGLTLEAVFAYGAGGTTCIAVIQTSADSGNNWRDIARFDFAQLSRVAVANLSGLLSKAVTTYAALSAEGVTDGVLGDRLRCVITSTGTYSGNTTLAIRAVAR